MTFVCFLGALPVSLVALQMGPMVLFKVYGIALNMIKNLQELQEITLYCDVQFTGETTAHTEMISITGHFKQIIATLELTALTTGGGCKIITVAQYILQLILCSYDLIVPLYICLHFSELQMAPCMVCKCLCA